MEDKTNRPINLVLPRRRKVKQDSSEGETVLDTVTKVSKPDMSVSENNLGEEVIGEDLRLHW